MRFTFAWVELFAQIDRWRDMGRDFREDHPKLTATEVFVSLVIFAAVVAFLWVLSRLMQQQEGRRLYNSPRHLFRNLCRAHDLTRLQQRLLSNIARLQQLPQPASLFLEPDRFETVLRHPTMRSQQRQIVALRNKLFGDQGAGNTSKDSEPSDTSTPSA